MAQFNLYNTLSDVTLNAADIVGVWDTSETEFKNITVADLADFFENTLTWSAADIVSGTFNNARIAQSNVTQHQAALSISWSQLTGKPTTVSGYGITDAYTQAETNALTWNASAITAGFLADARISASSVQQHVDLSYINGLNVDADTLDGQHGSYYQNANNLNAGFVPVARMEESTRQYLFDPKIPEDGELVTHLDTPSIGQAAIEKSFMANRTMLIDTSKILIEGYNGSTWSDITSNYTDTELKNLVAGRNIGNIQVAYNSYEKVRIEFTAPSYCFLSSLYFYASTQGHTMAVKIERHDYGSDTWFDVNSQSSYRSTWPGHWWINHERFGWHPSAQNDKVRVEFEFAWNGTYSSNPVYLYALNWWGPYPINPQNQIWGWNNEGDMFVRKNLAVGSSSGSTNTIFQTSGNSTQLLIGYNGASTNYYDANTHYWRTGAGVAQTMLSDGVFRPEKTGLDLGDGTYPFDLAYINTVNVNTAVYTDFIGERTGAAGVTMEGMLFKDNDITGVDQIFTNGDSDRSKICLYTNTSQSIGFQSGITAGGGSDWAIIFQNSTQDTRKFVFGKSSDGVGDAGVVIRTDGKMNVADSIRLGYGRADTTAAGTSTVGTNTDAVFTATYGFTDVVGTQAGMELNFSDTGLADGVYPASSAYYYGLALRGQFDTSDTTSAGSLYKHLLDVRAVFTGGADQIRAGQFEVDLDHSGTGNIVHDAIAVRGIVEANNGSCDDLTGIKGTARLQTTDSIDYAYGVEGQLTWNENPGSWDYGAAVRGKLSLDEASTQGYISAGLFEVEQGGTVATVADARVIYAVWDGDVASTATNAYLIKANVATTNTVFTNGLWGIHIEGADQNLLTGDTEIDGTLTTQGTNRLNGITHIQGLSGGQGSGDLYISLYDTSYPSSEELGFIDFGRVATLTSSQQTGAEIQAFAVGAWSASDYETILYFKTCGVNSTTLENRMRIQDGSVEFYEGIKEAQYNLSGTDIDPANGTVQYKTLTANTTLTESLSDGEYVILWLADGASAYTVTWPTITWLCGGGTAPTLPTTGFMPVTLQQVNGAVYGSYPENM